MHVRQPSSENGIQDTGQGSYLHIFSSSKNIHSSSFPQFNCPDHLHIYSIVDYPLSRISWLLSFFGLSVCIFVSQVLPFQFMVAISALVYGV